MSISRKIYSLLFACMILLSNYANDNDAQKIEYLLNSIGNSNCVFIRNKKEYSSKQAEKHLRKKYQRGKKWVKNVDHFIKRIASKSYLSKKPYAIRCGKEYTQATSDWLRKQLLKYSKDNPS